MKIRTDFVTNSSSSSFIIGVENIPKTKEEMINMFWMDDEDCYDIIKEEVIKDKEFIDKTWNLISNQEEDIKATINIEKNGPLEIVEYIANSHFIEVCYFANIKYSFDIKADEKKELINNYIYKEEEDKKEIPEEFLIFDKFPPFYLEETISQSILDIVKKEYKKVIGEFGNTHIYTQNYFDRFLIEVPRFIDLGVWVNDAYVLDLDYINLTYEHSDYEQTIFFDHLHVLKYCYH